MRTQQEIEAELAHQKSRRDALCRAYAIGEDLKIVRAIIAELEWVLSEPVTPVKSDDIMEELYNENPPKGYTYSMYSESKTTIDTNKEE